MANRRIIARTMPGSTHAKGFAHRGDLAAGREAAGLAHMNSNVVDEPFGDERRPFVRAVEQFTHGYRSRALLAYLTEISDVFRGEWIFEEEQFEPFDIFRQLHCLVGAYALVDVMEQ